MLIQGKVNFFTILLLSPIFPNVCGNRRSASRNRPRRQECRDNSRTHSTCVKLINELGRQACHVDIDQIKAKLARSCTATCGFCGRPQKECRRNVYGCCWDGQTPSGDMYGIKGCPECKDHLNICGRFRKFCFGKRSENRYFIELHCPLTCKRCKKMRNVPVKGTKVQMSDWLRI
ncbi:uncharacterized protein [Montipora foliosa]|uniref:uncharacterized protein isoform X2 n=1 Tax=Montipora foliosa TaxID=591990 RepID=UPI0035F1827A